MTRSNDRQQGGQNQTRHCLAERRMEGVLVIDSARLLADQKEVQIRHGDELYRLRVTRNGKLILNK
jgi:hemin uptake protein HemP